MVKKVLLVAMALVMVMALLAGCGGGGSSTPAAGGSSTPAAGGSSAPAAGGDDPFYVGLCFGAMDATPAVLSEAINVIIKEKGWKVAQTNADQDINKHLGDVESVLEMGVDVIFARVINDLGATMIIEVCEKAGVPLVLMNFDPSTIEEYSGRYLSCVNDPEEQRGKALAEWINNYVKENPGFEANVGFVVGDYSAPIGYHRWKNFFDPDGGWCPEINHLVDAESDPKWTATGGMKVTEDWLQKYDEMNMIIACSDEVATGVIQALQAAGKQPGEIMVFAFDGLPIMFDYVRDGWMTASSGIAIAKQAQVMMDVAQMIADGKIDEVPESVDCHAIYILDETTVDAIDGGDIDSLPYYEY